MSSTTAAKLLRVRKFREIPGPLRIPLWGNLHLYKLGIYKKEEYHEVLLKLAAKYGPLVREDIGPNNTIIHVFDPVDAKTVFANEGPMPVVEPLQETTQLYRKQKNTSPGLGNANGEEWYKLRSAVRIVMLRPKEVQRYLPDVNKISDEFVKRLDELRDKKTGEIADLRVEIGKWSREVSGWVCFGRRLFCFDKGERELQSAKMIRINRKVFELSSELKFSLPFYKYIPTAKWRKLVNLEETIHKYTVDLVEEAIKSNRKDSSSFISYLLSQKELSEKDVQILILSVFGDGLSTTVPSLIYNLYCLSANPKVQNQVRDEIRAVIGSGNYVSAEAIGNLQLLKAVVKESFRMYPIGTEISRVLQDDLILSNYHVPKGTHVHLNQIVQYRSDKYFDKPNEFIPERWLRDGNNEIDPLLLVPFGHGTRTCAGRRFAEQDLYVLISKILLNFELGYPEKTLPLQQIYQVLLFPKEPVRIQFKPINK